MHRFGPAGTQTSWPAIAIPAAPNTDMARKSPPPSSTIAASLITVARSAVDDSTHSLPFRPLAACKAVETVSMLTASVAMMVKIMSACWTASWIECATVVLAGGGRGRLVVVEDIFVVRR